MNILAFGASSSTSSINKELAKYAASFFDQDDITILDLNDFEMPLFSVDKEQQSGHPLEAIRFLKMIGEADLIIISLAEHNGSYSTAFKNIFDWSSRVMGKTFQDKPMLLLATSPGARGGSSVLETAKTRFPFHAARILESFSLPEFYKNYTQGEGIINVVYRDKFQKIIDLAKSKLTENIV
ncbi:MAG: NAD(P)H-dependent oxidoreductase [Saprospiraceae bacterium]|nr:NAD(P)H-dependent oxidoreductase [Saprospiraceae bacterium]